MSNPILGHRFIRRKTFYEIVLHKRKRKIHLLQRAECFMDQMVLYEYHQQLQEEFHTQQLNLVHFPACQDTCLGTIHRVKKILARRRFPEGVKYLVQWKGNVKTWEFACCLANAHRLLYEFRKRSYVLAGGVVPISTAAATLPVVNLEPEQSESSYQPSSISQEFIKKEQDQDQQPGSNEFIIVPSNIDEPTTSDKSEQEQADISLQSSPRGMENDEAPIQPDFSDDVLTVMTTQSQPITFTIQLNSFNNGEPQDLTNKILAELQGNASQTTQVINNTDGIANREPQASGSGGKIATMNIQSTHVINSTDEMGNTEPQASGSGVKIAAANIQSTHVMLSEGSIFPPSPQSDIGDAVDFSDLMNFVVNDLLDGEFDKDLNMSDFPFDLL